MNTKYRLMIACLCSLPVGFSALSAHFDAGARTIQSQKIPHASEDVRPLVPGAPVEREISVEQTHAYRIELTEGQFVQAFVQQKGKEILATLLGPDGQKLNEYTEPLGENRKREILFIAQSNGSYSLIITTRKKATAPALYQVGVEVVRPATEQDRTRARATQLVKEARYVYWRVNPISDDEMRSFAGKFEEAMRLWESLDDQWMMGETMLDLGILYGKAGDYTKSVALYEKSLPLFPQTPDGLSSKATALNNLADMHYRLGETRKALEVYVQSLELKKEGRSRAITLDNIGGVYARLGDYQQALDLSQQALTSFRESGHIRDEAVALNNIAMVWGKIGDFHHALDYQLQSLARIRETGDKSQEANGLINAGNLSLRMGDNQQALEYAKESLALSRAVKNPRAEADGLSLLCQIHLSQGETEKALETCNRALPMHQSGKDRESEALTHFALGQIHLRTGDARKAVESNEAALALYRATGNTFAEISILHSLGRIALERGDLAAARGQIERVVEMVESMRVNSASPNLRSTFLAGHQRVYETFVDLLMQMHKQEPGKGYDRFALQISERARARSLLDLLTESRAQIRKGADRQLLERERDLLQLLKDKDSAWKRLKTSDRTKKQAVSIADEINDLTTQLQLVESRIRSSSPRYAALTRPEPLGAAEIQQVIDENTVLLEYAPGEKRGWMWAVTQNSIDSCELPPRAEIETASRKVYELLTTRQLKKDVTDAERLKRIAEADAKLQSESATLSRMLLGPITEKLRREWKGKRLAIVASGTLEYVPFAVLQLTEAETEGRGDRETGRQGPTPPVIPSPNRPVAFIPLIENHEIVNLPSASALAIIRREAAGRRPATKTLAALADPVFEANDPRLATARKKTSTNGLIASVRAAESAPAASLLPSELGRSVRSFQRDGFGRLFFSNEEADFITSLAPRTSTLKATGFEASRQLVASGELGRYRIVHFATHGLINSEHPELSGLVLSLLDENGKPQDGFLRMSEVFNLEMPADLVVLSACQTALGKEIKGEGLVGLTRGFMYAGAERVVASLWQVDDLATAHLMKRFYLGMLKDGLRPAEALRAAQIELSKQKRWSAPYYWAGFVIQGEWR